MTTDEQRALELADLLHTAYEAELEHEHGIEHMAAFLLPLIRDQGRWQAYRKYRATPAADLSPAWQEFLMASVCEQNLQGAIQEVELDAAIDKVRGET
jgi:hypothetical protein